MSYVPWWKNAIPRIDEFHPIRLHDSYESETGEVVKFSNTAIGRGRDDVLSQLLILEYSEQVFMKRDKSSLPISECFLLTLGELVTTRLVDVGWIQIGGVARIFQGYHLLYKSGVIYSFLLV